MAFDWHRLLTGRWSKSKFSALYLPAVFLLLCCWTLARTLYPLDDGYGIDIHRISRQGNIYLNPIGGWFFIVSTGMTGLFFILYYIFVYRRLLGHHIFLARLFLFCGCLGGIGLFLVGVCPEGSRQAVQMMHDTGTGMAFGGTGCAAGLSFIILFLKLRHQESWPSWGQVWILALMVFHFVFIMFFIANIHVLMWAGFSAVLVWQLGIFLILPEDADHPKDN